MTSILLKFGLCFLLSFAQSSPELLIEQPDCGGMCRGTWGQWTEWDECSGRECHVEMGRQTRQNLCFVLSKQPPSRGDSMRAKEQNGSEVWRATCRETEAKNCVREQTCSGTWTVWGEWTKCSMSRGADCFRSRQRSCWDGKGRLLARKHCYGELNGDTEHQTCNDSCPQSRMSSVDGIAVTTAESTKNQAALQPEESVNTKKSKRGLSHNTILIIAVAIGSLVFGAVFVLLILNVVRKSRRGDVGSSSSRERWKRIGSTTTSSTVYSAASDIMSSSGAAFVVQSPSSMTVSSETSSTGLRLFGRSDSRSPLSAQMTVLPGQPDGRREMAANEENKPPRRSRLLQENVYWEITDTTSLSFGSDAEEPPMELQESGNNSRELVQNVLYGSRV